MRFMLSFCMHTDCLLLNPLQVCKDHSDAASLTDVYSKLQQQRLSFDIAAFADEMLITTFIGSLGCNLPLVYAEVLLVTRRQFQVG